MELPACMTDMQANADIPNYLYHHTVLSGEISVQQGAASEGLCILLFVDRNLLVGCFS